MEDSILNQFHYSICKWRQSELAKNEKNLSIEQLRQKIDFLVGKNACSEFFISIQSNVGEDMHLGFYDFDMHTYHTHSAYYETKDKMLTTVINRLKAYRMNGYLFETQKGYHFVYDHLLSENAYFDSLEYMKTCKGFREIAKVKGFSSLRIGCKPSRKEDIEFLGHYEYGYDKNNEVHPLVIDYLKARDILSKEMSKIYIRVNGIPEYNYTHINALTLDDTYYG